MLIIFALFGILFLVSFRKHLGRNRQTWLYTLSLMFMFGLHPLVTTSANLSYLSGVSQSAVSLQAQQPYIACWEGQSDNAYTISAPSKSNIQLRLIDRELLERKAFEGSRSQ